MSLAGVSLVGVSLVGVSIAGAVCSRAVRLQAGAESGCGDGEDGRRGGGGGRGGVCPRLDEETSGDEVSLDVSDGRWNDVGGTLGRDA